MSNYNSENTTILATHEQGGRTRMLLLHRCDNGDLEYIVGSNFQQKRYDGALGYERWDYEWDWGHYYFDIVRAVEFYKAAILGESARKEWVEDAWKRFGDTPIDDDECIDEPFWMKPGKLYPKGTDRFEVWRDFDELYADWGGVYALVYPGESR